MDISSLQPVWERGQAPSQPAPGDLRRAAQEFESYFIAYLLKVMRETVPVGFLESEANKHYYYFYDQEIARLAAEGGGIGLGAMLEAELARYEPDGQGNNVLKSEPAPADKKAEVVRNRGR